ALNPQPGAIVADCTLGYGGHAVEFLNRIGLTGRLLGFDVDAEQLQCTGERLKELGGGITLHRSNFAGIDKPLRRGEAEGYDIIFADLGVSSMQLDDPTRGFSYKHDGPLDMRMDDRLHDSAADLVNSLCFEELADALDELADEPDADRIARVILYRRARRPFQTTRDLVQAVFDAKQITRKQWRELSRSQPGELHPAARTFQALR